MTSWYRTHCGRMDHGGCSLKVGVERGRITRLRGDPEGALAAVGALDRVIRPGLSWSVQELRFDGEEVLIRVRGQISGIGTVREVQGRYRRPNDEDPADARGDLFGWTELLEH